MGRVERGIVLPAGWICQPVFRREPPSGSGPTCARAGGRACGVWECVQKVPRVSIPTTAARARRVAEYIELPLPSLDSHTTRILIGSRRAYSPKVTAGLPDSGF